MTSILLGMPPLKKTITPQQFENDIDIIDAAKCGDLNKLNRLLKFSKMDPFRRLMAMEAVIQAGGQLDVFNALYLLGPLEMICKVVNMKMALFSAALQYHHHAIFDLLLKSQRLTEPSERGELVKFAAAVGNLEGLNKVLARGNIYSGTRSVAVLQATEARYIEIVRVLLHSGDISAEAKKNALAQAKGSAEMEKLLQSALVKERIHKSSGVEKL